MTDITIRTVPSQTVPRAVNFCQNVRQTSHLHNSHLNLIFLFIAYEEMEYVVPYNIHNVKSSGGRYLFISVCVLSTFFSVVLLLMILSKVVIFAKKSAYMQARTNPYTIDDITLHQRTSLSRNDPLNYRRNFPCDIRTYRGSRGSRPNCLLLGSCEVSNPLLVPVRSVDQPPAYSEVVGGFATTASSITDPPPPYTSQEVLNVDDDRIRSNN